MKGRIQEGHANWKQYIKRVVESRITNQNENAILEGLEKDGLSEGGTGCKPIP